MVTGHESSVTDFGAALLGGEQGPQDRNPSQQHFISGVRPRLLTSRFTTSRRSMSRPITPRITWLLSHLPADRIHSRVPQCWIGPPARLSSATR